MGNYFITINPFLLEIYLVREWWETFARITSEKDFNSFIESIPEEFRRDFYYGFITHFPFIRTTEPGKKLLNNMLSTTGIFSDGNIIKSNLGSDFFTKLGEASPDLALEILKKTIAVWDDTKLSEFIEGRNNILYFLKKLAYRAEYFEDTQVSVKNSEVKSKIKFVAGNFFDSISEKADTILMSRVLHDWNDSNGLKILRNIHSSLKKNGRLLLFETIVPDEITSDVGIRLNFNLLVCVGGKERTLKEFQKLLQNTNLLINEVKSGNGIISLIIAQKK